ncbi:MarR family winged helix-turn-helix transcriptional regulator [Mycobacterium sp. E1386]|uniref:MarR family winged helix-turn-helix transcriptional regulator n=1 Tax=Mycobacterium sp. E1386 TaxID=1834126 RepID=UPI001E41E5C2|nr:MarR family winged helix-turn-helix transcriptional regulator [Mycobacterium sp. E1386]
MSERSGKSMPAIDAAKIWSLNYRMLLSVISCAEADICALGLESKELFLLAEIDEHPYPAELAATLSMPKATVTVYLKRLEAAGFVRREIDASDLRRHRLLLTPAGRKAAADGLALLSDEFNKRLGRLTAAQQKELKGLLERIV